MFANDGSSRHLLYSKQYILRNSQNFEFKSSLSQARFQFLNRTEEKFFDLSYESWKGKILSFGCSFIFEGMNSFIVGSVKVKLMIVQLFFDNIDISIIFAKAMVETVEIYTSVIKSVRPSLIVPGRIQPENINKFKIS